MGSGAGLVAVSLAALSTPAPGSVIEDWVLAFEQSDIEFQRSISNAPFPPIAFIEATHYDNIDLSLRNGRELSYDHSSISQAAGVPFLVGDRDALFVGEYLSRSRFEARSAGRKSFDVHAVGIPVGWLRQASPAWQLTGFVMPLGHKASLDGASWEWEYMGGAFARYVQNDRLWWAAGFFADVGPGDDMVLPYMGASWAISEQWLLSAVMPWPGISWAPSGDAFVRLGISPSGTSWSLQDDQNDLSFELDAWDFGLSAGRRLGGNLWGRVEAGVGGLQGLSISNDSVHEPEFELDSSPYLSLGLEFRP
ncbi:hypothetical protein GCM10011348_31700 [Marinobacterium nitratireducens]|uniref:Uncharacterized protein n=2 Tax=Marinobacterium nitratireducens TaxID=518897 RepID=A0A917ZLZ1_9GAMM|nr:hypothetical protein GCM10011348_31700 [Marinobacterium nitratireducens]